MRSTSHEILTIKEVAAMLRVTPQTIRRWCREGGMPHFRLFGQLRFRGTELDEWIGRLSDGESARN